MGQINIIALSPLVASGALDSQHVSATGSALWLMIQKHWVPSYFFIDYTAGFPEGMMPRALNEIIGATAAMDILNDMVATYKVSSHSLGIDGMSQSQSIGQIYKAKLDSLAEKKHALIKKIKPMFGSTWSAGTI